MSSVSAGLSKISMALAVAALGIMTALPVNAYALGSVNPPADATPAASYPRLQQAWQREQQIYTRLGYMFDHVDQRLQHGQQLIDRAKANGKDVTALQAALDALSAAIKEARPVYEGGQGIVSSHKGFDASGNVFDPVQALQTVQDIRSKLQEIRDLLGGPAQAMRDAIQQFRQANHPATPTPSGT